MFKELFTESIEPKEIKFGTNYPDFDNSKPTKFYSADARIFKYNKIYGVLIGEEGDVSFGAIDYDENKSIQDNFFNISNKRVQTNNPILVFNYVFYILIEMLKSNKIDQLSFNGSDKKLKTLYNSLVKNKIFLNKLETTGFTYDGYEDGLHWFIRE